MSLTFPRSITKPRRWASARFRPMHRQELSRRASGQTQAKDFGRLLWTATFRSMPMTYAEAMALEVELQSAGGAREQVWVHTAEAPFPMSISDPSGHDFSGAQVNSVAADRLSATFGGVPPNFVFSPGDWVSITDAGGTKHLHRVQVGATSSGGATPTVTLDLLPSVHPAVAAANSAAFIDPEMTARMMPDDPFSIDRISGNLWGAIINVIQDI